MIKNSVEDVSDERAVDAFSAGLRHSDLVEELGRAKPKIVSELMEVADGAVMMVPENLLAFVDEVKMTGQLETPREGLMNIAASFPSVMKPR
jgi:hypothetical protein